jgi:MscS family membrane protein
MRARIAPLLGLSLAFVAPALWAQPHPPTNSTSEPPASRGEEESVAPDSPRASMANFYDLARRRRWGDAARYLDVPHAQLNEAPRLAQRLKEVLDRHLWLQPATLSSSSHGDPDDGLAANVEEIGVIPGPDEGPDPVRLVRKDSSTGARWVFSRATVQRVNVWYGRLEGHWLRDHLPPWLLTTGPRDLLWWQWIALPLLGLVGFAVGRLLAWLTGRLTRRFTASRETWWSETLRARAKIPLTAFWTVIVVRLAAPWLHLYRPAQGFVEGLLRAALFGVVFWGFWRTIDVFARTISESAWADGHPSADTLIPLGARVARIVVFIVAVIVVLSQLGYAVTSLLAGLGIGGLALALAAQKTGEHLLGSIAIGIDQPFRVGDYVKVDDVTGTIESVGLRSTQIRTDDRTLVTIPNGKLADMRTESYTARDRMRLYCTLPLAHGTTAEQVRKATDGIRAKITAHPKHWPDTTYVMVKDITLTAVNLEVWAWFTTTSFDEFTGIRHEMLLSFLEVLTSEGVKLTELPVAATGDAKKPS